jgi:hypothetical protein
LAYFTQASFQPRRSIAKLTPLRPVSDPQPLEDGISINDIEIEDVTEELLGGLELVFPGSGGDLLVDNATDYTYADAWFALMAPPGVYASALEVLEIVADDTVTSAPPTIHGISVVCSPGFHAKPFPSHDVVTYGETVVTPAGRGQCLPCEAGTYARFAGSSVCGLCAAGSFSAPAASQCSPCPYVETLKLPIEPAPISLRLIYVWVRV